MMLLCSSEVESLFLSLCDKQTAVLDFLTYILCLLGYFCIFTMNTGSSKVDRLLLISDESHNETLTGNENYVCSDTHVLLVLINAL